MPSIKNMLAARRNLLVASAVWLILWIVPWGRLPVAPAASATAILPDLVRVAVALGMFVFPGILLCLLLRDRTEQGTDAAGIIAIGFSLSVFIIGVIGFIGRVVGLSFAVVEALFALVGCVELLLLMRTEPGFKIAGDGLRPALSELVVNMPLLVALVISVSLLINPDLFFIDDTTYAAYLMTWQHSTHLGFQAIIYGIPAAESIRFWLALFPMGQAVIAQVSGLPGLVLLGNYLEFFLVPIAIIALFWQCRQLGLSARAAGLAVLLQVSLYAWMQGDQWPPGFWFFQNMAEDKVAGAFILAPVFSVFVVRYLRRPRNPSLLLVLFSGFALTLTHPVPLFYACALACGVALVARMLRKTGWRATLLVWGAAVVLLAPYVLVRLSPSMAPLHMTFDSEGSSYEISKYTHAVGSVFYGLNPGVLEFMDLPGTGPGHTVYQAVRLVPAVILLLTCILALLALTRGPIYWHAALSTLLVGAATLPYTGWLLGYFVSARMISRTSWFAPFGVGIVLLAQELIRRLHTSWYSRKRAQFVGLSCAVGACCIFVAPLLAYRMRQQVTLYAQSLEHNKQLAEIGGYVDQHTLEPATVLALDYTDILKLPAVAARAKLISFREEVDDNGMNSFLSLDDIHARKEASNAIRGLDRGATGAERRALMDKYGVRYVVAGSGQVQQFEQLLGLRSGTVRVVFRTRDLALLEFK